MSVICENPSSCFNALNLFAAQSAASFSGMVQTWSVAIVDAAAASKADFAASGADAVQWLNAVGSWAQTQWSLGSVQALESWMSLNIVQKYAVFLLADLLIVGLWRLFTAKQKQKQAQPQAQKQTKTVDFALDQDNGLRRSLRQRTSFVPWSPPLTVPKPATKMAHGNGKPIRLNGLNDGQMLYHDVKTTQGVYDTRGAPYRDGFVHWKRRRMTLHAFAIQHMRDLIAAGEFTGKASCTIYQRPSAHGLYAKSKKGAKVPISNFC